MSSVDRLAEVASSVADGVPVDWESADVQVPAQQRRLVRHLRLVENISQLHRSLPDEDFPTAEPAGELPPIDRWGPLVLLERIGQGMSGEVHRAWDSRLHRDVALKLLHHDRRTGRDAQERVLDEARRLARIRHEHVVSVYGAEAHDGRVGLWMELVRGESLEERVKTHGPLPAAEAARIGRQLCAALSAVHAAGLVHRDVKAQNVIVEPSGRTVLMDFGTGEELRQSAGSARLVGTPLYLAPEIFKGQPATVQSDIYSLGVLLFYLVTGQFPVTAASVTDLARTHRDGKRRELDEVRTDLPAPFVEAVERALSPDPARRQRTAAELEVALRPLPDAKTAASVISPRVVPWRRPLAAAAALLLVVTVALIVWTGIGFGPAVTRVAVLPFTYASDSTDAALIADILTDQLIATLGEIDTLRVTAPASVAGFAHSTPSSEIAAALGVDAVLRPKVTFHAPGRLSGRPGTVRVDADLIRADTGTILWSRGFTGEFGAMRSLHTAIAREVAATMRADVTPAESGRLAKTHTTIQAATEAYFQGLYHLKQLTPNDTRLAIAAFERAIELDPQFAPALAGLGRSYTDLGVLGAITHAEARALAAAQIDRALQLDGDSSEVRVANADLKFYYDWDWQGAGEEYQRAIDLNASSDTALFQYARYLAAAGQLDSALEHAERAYSVNPLSSRAALTVGLIHLFRRDYTAALSAIDEATRLDPKSANPYIVRSRVLAASGAIDEAVAAARHALSLSGQAPPVWRAHLLALRARAGERDDVLAEMRQLLADLEQDGTRMGPEHLAYIHLGLSDSQAALDHLERAADERSVEMLWLAVDPRVDPLRGAPRFERVLERLRGG